jgi:hypothetical protein
MCSVMPAPYPTSSSRTIIIMPSDKMATLLAKLAESLVDSVKGLAAKKIAELKVSFKV